MPAWSVGPFFYGHAKARLAPVLHNKVLYADADMAQADWTTPVARLPAQVRRA